MYFVYSFLLSIGFLVMLPMFLLRREKYASGFRERLGNYPEFKHDGRDVIWLHCVSVGETNAARPLVEKLLENFPNHRVVISNTTKTGHELAQKIFADQAAAIFYFPFDFKFSVRRALAKYKPSVVLLMETEIWPRFIHEAKQSGAKVAIVSGRLSQRSFARYSRVKHFVRNVLADVDLALMQGEADAESLIDLGIDANVVSVTGNLKFDQLTESEKSDLSDCFRKQYGIDGKIPIVIAASTHRGEEQAVLDALEMLGGERRLVVAPRHPERFDEVARLLEEIPFVRRSAPDSVLDRTAEVILLDSIGELRDLYGIADVVFVGGSLVPHGGQSVLEPAAEGKAIVTGPYTHNFADVVRIFGEHDALIQLPPDNKDGEMVMELYDAFLQLLGDKEKRDNLGKNALAVMKKNSGATLKTVGRLQNIFDSEQKQLTHQSPAS